MRKCLALAAAGLLALSVAAPTGASSGVYSLQIVGPGVFSLWTTAPTGEPEDRVDYVDTAIFAFNEQNAPPKYGPFEGAVFFQFLYHLEDGAPVLDSQSFAEALDASVAFRQPLRSASALATDVQLITCDEAECWEDGAVSFDVSWTGSGPIDREPVDPEIFVTPGVRVELFNSGPIDVFIRAVDVEYSLEGATIPSGSRLVDDPYWRSPLGNHGSRFFRVHAGGVTICHDGVVDPNTGACIAADS